MNNAALFSLENDDVFERVPIKDHRTNTFFIVNSMPDLWQQCVVLEQCNVKVVLEYCHANEKKNPILLPQKSNGYV